MKKLFSIKDKVAVITGGGGVLGSAMALGLASCGAKIALIDRSPEGAKKTVDEVEAAGGAIVGLEGDVLEREALQKALQGVLASYGRIDILVNAAGGNHELATTSPERNFFKLPLDALESVIKLNLHGTILPSQVFGAEMAKQGAGVVVNISSMNSFRPLTRIVGYSAAKAAINNFTQWLAVHLATEYSPAIRVNAIAPGFFETSQNSFLLREEKSGELTARAKQILSHTPQNRFGSPEDLVGTLVWLVSPASAFVTGTVIPVDGGFSAYSGV